MNIKKEVTKRTKKIKSPMEATKKRTKMMMSTPLEAITIGSIYLKIQPNSKS